MLKQRINDLEKENELLKSNEKLGFLFCQKLSELNEFNKDNNFQKEKNLLLKKLEILLVKSLILIMMNSRLCMMKLKKLVIL